MAKTITKWVIFAGPQLIKGPGTRYIAPDGTITGEKRNAKKFVSHRDATDFAKSKNIKVNGTRYIGQEDFLESEI